ncbi:hypothetical protein HHK36_003284 [Tetracentron sinense]|uniref:Uncharacterized protein n=1 Tax=Tetracentron sinense TaxID=13715 RepID=A0A835DSB4_TETSI|nr:hypothetical protein HHK36_003279 [Tetracentron sinense]KAF8410747.1 hypothetical protein HHK36_003284 [Tetracentron sinense]
MAKPHQIPLTLFALLLIFPTNFTPATATLTVKAKYEIACTMCSSCENPCHPVPSPPPPSPPPATPPPPPPSSVSECPPPPSPPSSGTYYSPPPPSQPTYSYGPPPPHRKLG